MTAVTMSAWWSVAVGNPKLPRDPSEPQPGYYKTRLGKACPWVAARIWRDEGILHCRIGDDAAEPLKAWTSLRPIPIREWAALEKARREDARFANPRNKIDLTEEPAKP